MHDDKPGNIEREVHHSFGNPLGVGRKGRAHLAVAADQIVACRLDAGDVASAELVEANKKVEEANERAAAAQKALEERGWIQ